MDSHEAQFFKSLVQAVIVLMSGVVATVLFEASRLCHNLMR